MNLESLFALLFASNIIVPIFIFICFGLGKNKLRNIFIYASYVLISCALVPLLDFAPNLKYLIYIFIGAATVTQSILCIECIVNKLKNIDSDIWLFKNETTDFSVKSFFKNIVSKKAFILLPLAVITENIILSIRISDFSKGLNITNTLTVSIIVLSVLWITLASFYKLKGETKDKLWVINGIVFYLIILISGIFKFHCNIDNIFLLVISTIIDISIGTTLILSGNTKHY